MTTALGGGLPLSVVVCTYTAQRHDVFTTALHAVRAQLDAAVGDELVVIVDHNEDLLQQVTVEFPDARVLANTGPQGLSGARNTGVAAAHGDVVVFLDDDAVPRAGWLEGLRADFRRDAVSVVGGGVVPAWEGGHAPHWFPEEFGWIVGCDYRGMPADGGEMRNPIGANMAVRASAFGVVDGFDTSAGRVGSLPVGCEETDFCIRLRQAEPASVVVRRSSAAVDHRVPRKRQTVSYLFSRCWHEGRSKGLLSARVGSQDGLSSERSYVVKAVGGGVLRHLSALARGEIAGPARAGLLAAGTVVTAAGYASTRRTTPAPSATTTATTTTTAGFRPLRMIEVDLHGDGFILEEGDARVRLLVTADDRPIDLVDVPEHALDRPRPTHVHAAEVRNWLQQDGADRLVRPDHRIPPPSASGIPGTVAVSVVVPTAGRGEQLVRCVGSLLAQRFGDIEVIVVDNNPTPGHVAGLLTDQLARDSRLRLVHEPDGGSSGARNRGIREARADVIAATDDDVIAHPAWVGTLLGVFTDPEVDAVTGLVLADGLRVPAQETFEQYGGFSKGLDPRRFTRDSHREENPLHPYSAGKFGSGNNVAYRRSAVLAAGGYDPLLGPGSVVRAGQDLDLFLALLFAGCTLVYEPAAMVFHEHRDSTEQLHRQVHNYGRGLAAVIAKHVSASPERALGVLVRMPRAARYLLSPSSEKNAGRGADYPRTLSWAEYRGLAEGVPAYVRGRLDVAARTTGALHDVPVVTLEVPEPRAVPSEPVRTVVLPEVTQPSGGAS
ncbi:glycosyltransferase [Kineococcus sp. GCM10028916]|uniref:glycosyltransferase n=1 Tax=Kineococcus sp. GCM10028916 TaxID=3273394 RepID=UPI00362FC766